MQGLEKGPSHPKRNPYLKHMLENLGTETTTWGNCLGAAGAHGECGGSLRTTQELGGSSRPRLTIHEAAAARTTQLGSALCFFSLAAGNEDLAKPPSVPLFFFFFRGGGSIITILSCSLLFLLHEYFQTLFSLKTIFLNSDQRLMQ